MIWATVMSACVESLERAPSTTDMRDTIFATVMARVGAFRRA